MSVSRRHIARIRRPAPPPASRCRSRAPSRRAAPIKLGSVLDNSGNLDAYGKPMVHGERAGRRGDQRRRRPARPQDPGRAVRQPVGHRALHQVRAAARARRQGRRRPRRHHVGVARGDPADVPPRQHRSTSTTCSTKAACATATASSPARRRRRRWSRSSRYRDEEVGQEGLRARGRLQLRPDHRQVGRALRRAAQGTVLQTDFFPLDVADFGSTIAKIQDASAELRSAPRWSAARTSRSSGSGRRRA